MPGPKKNSKSSQNENTGEKSFPVVAIGASAGGLEALEAFFDKMPSDTGMAFVVVQHISPEGKSMLGDILKKRTRMAILNIEAGLPLEPDHIYLNPPRQDVVISQSIFQLEESTATRGVRLPIDHFFRSLAREKGEKAICIIFSGTGSDGTMGLKAIKESAGMAMVQDVEQAKYGGMPSSALATGLVDYILPVEKMPEVLVNYAKHPYLKQPGRIEGKEKQFTAYIQAILDLIRSETGNDFSGYKPKTLRRRIERRMALHKIEAIWDYHRFLKDAPREINLLFQELLIGVTQFFRDPSAFEVLREKAIPRVLERKAGDSPIRIWVPGCSTGEEALSIAMLFSEALESSGEHVEMQIFATDVDSDAIKRARTAEYPEAISADVSAARLKRFFIRKDGVYRVKTELREKIVYAAQNLISDPPFLRLDLISCRNVLIYMDAALQKKIIPLFHYTLNPDGYLFLGSSETVGGYSSLFSALDAKWKLFKVKKDSHRAFTPELAMTARQNYFDFDRMKEKAGEERAESALDRLIVQEYAPATILINDKCDAIHFRGPINRYLNFQAGQASLNLLKIAPSAISLKLPAAVKKAFSEKVPVVIPKVQVKQENEYRTVTITVRPFSENEDPNFLVVMFDETPPAEPVAPDKVKASRDDRRHPRVIELENELQLTRQNLQSTIEELETANEELKSSNEELQSTNEEIQSTNEELATAREELQSTNEELVTVNSELQGKVDELTELNDDINNLYASTEIGMIFLDNHLRIKRYTPAMKKFFNLIASDVGRSLGDITSKISLDSILGDVEDVHETLQACGKEVMADGRWFSMRILPYRTTDNQINGVVITFIDINELKRIEHEMEKARAYAENIVNTVRGPLLILNGDLKVVSANRSFLRFFGVSLEETVGEIVYDLGNGQWNIPGFRKLLEEVLADNSSFEDFLVEHEFPSVGHKKMILNARKIVDENGDSELILLAMEDGTTNAEWNIKTSPGSKRDSQQ